MDFFQDPFAYVPPKAEGGGLAPEKQQVIPRLTKGETVTGFAIPSNQDGAAMAKMRIIRDKIVNAALTGENLVYTRSVLAELLKGAPSASNGHKAGQWALVCHVFFGFRSRVRYVLDPKGKELFQALPVTMRTGLGDCDDFTGGLAALLKAAGLRVMARCVTQKRLGPYVHIYPLVMIGGQWIALDATTSNPPGWECRHSRALDLEL